MSYYPREETMKMVENMAGMGMPQDMIATIVGINPRTLAKRFRKQIDMGKAKACFKVSSTLYDKATRDRDTGSLIWWTKTQMGWKEDRGPTEREANAPKPLDAASREELYLELLSRGEPSPAPEGNAPQIIHEPMKDVIDGEAVEPKLNGINGHTNGKSNGHA